MPKKTKAPAKRKLPTPRQSPKEIKKRKAKLVNEPAKSKAGKRTKVATKLMQVLPQPRTEPVPLLAEAYTLRLPGKNSANFLEVPASPQQCGLFDWIKHGNGNAFVEAVAGSGKTTSLTQGCRFMKGSIAMTCFNKKIAVDIGDKLTKLHVRNVQSGTFHSFGFQACRKVYPATRIDELKKRDGMFDALRPPNMMEFPPKLKGIVSKLVSLGKQSGVCLYWLPEDIQRWRDIIEHYSLDEDVENPDDIERAIEFAIAGISWSRKVASKIMDFDDMIWLPIISDMKVSQFDWVLVDEAQDTNAARRALAKKMMKPNGRIVFVGDRHQSIYGFTGADSDAIDILIQDFKCVQLPLTVTYRCPQAVVREAQKYVKHITAWEQASLGSVASVNKQEFLEKETSILTPECAILCRNTKPVVALAFQLIRKGIACHVEGRDIGQGLIKLAQRWKVKDIGDLHDRLEAYLEREVAKFELAKKEAKAEAIRDRVETLFILMEGCTEVRQVIDKITNMFKDTENGNNRTVTLSTVHKAKGREWNKVYILGFNKYMPSKWAKQSWEVEQENNVIYVAITRAIKELVYTEHMEEEKR